MSGLRGYSAIVRVNSHGQFYWWARKGVFCLSFAPSVGCKTRFFIYFLYYQCVRLYEDIINLGKEKKIPADLNLIFPKVCHIVDSCS